VLDTHVVLDWLVFDDPSARPWVHALTSGALDWVATDCMQAEWERVLTYKNVACRRPSADLLRLWQAHARLCPHPPDCGLRCADPDDQVFIDLAVAQQARWLLTKDKALRALGRRARALTGLEVLTPAQWAVAAGQCPRAAS
jgi:predicted nucleic acid-binding protein